MHTFPIKAKRKQKWTFARIHRLACQRNTLPCAPSILKHRVSAARESLSFGTGVLLSSNFLRPQIIRPSFSKTPNNQLSSFDNKFDTIKWLGQWHTRNIRPQIISPTANFRPQITHLGSQNFRPQLMHLSIISWAVGTAGRPPGNRYFRKNPVKFPSLG